MSATPEGQALALAWLNRVCAGVRRWSLLAVAAGVAASLAFAGFAFAVAALVAAWLGPPAAPDWRLLLLIPLLLLLRSALLALRDWAGARAAVALRGQVRGELLDALQRLGPLRRRAGDDGALAALVLEQVDALDGYVSRYLPQRHIAALVPLLLMLLALPQSWLAALLLAVTAPLIPVFMTLVGWGAAAAAQAQAAALARLSGQFLDLVRGLPTLRLLGAVERGAQRLAATAAEFRQRSLAVLRLAFLSSAVLELFAAVSIAMLALYLGLALLGRIDIGHYGRPLRLDTALFLLLLAPEFFAPLRQLGSDYHARADALAAAEALAGLQARAAERDAAPASATGTPDDSAAKPMPMASERTAAMPAERARTAAADASAATLEPAAPDERKVQRKTPAPDAPSAPARAGGVETSRYDSTPAAAAPGIEFDHVSLRYPDGRHGLYEVSFRIGAGEHVLLRGPSGSGKTSVLALLAGFIAPTSGRILIDGQDLATLDRATWWRRLGWLEQRPEWFRLALRDNVLLGLERGDEDRLWAALRQAGLDAVVRALPQGADSVAGTADGSLSGGQLQRLALARALARDARLWLLDEPLAHLDAETAQELRSTLAAAGRGRTVLLASHAPAESRWIARELRLERGRLCHDGVPAARQGWI
ncbi:thiol reductant ABC exporter subunit CydD [Tahibacter harae]|uniref:Thiol reductant ABC exporter subunit CydD n=1 Tax=Tahibacter harae TaxID=2963937 RepID=A0ABT1QWY6_9GAMM|nr:thiol reductant ABC exporter subunit CydD [Tahibacter harae]MCQ4166804.1 thiol reductant ABC exporter subunit CydD [Tahibacter harae]